MTAIVARCPDCAGTARGCPACMGRGLLTAEDMPRIEARIAEAGWAVDFGDHSEHRWSAILAGWTAARIALLPSPAAADWQPALDRLAAVAEEAARSNGQPRASVHRDAAVIRARVAGLALDANLAALLRELDAVCADIEDNPPTRGERVARERGILATLAIVAEAHDCQALAALIGRTSPNHAGGPRATPPPRAPRTQAPQETDL